MKILEQLPIPQADTHAFVGTESVRFKKDQIIVWVSLVLESAGPPSTAATRYARHPQQPPHLAVDGEHASVTLRTPDWRTRLLTWLA